jgi:hypothetical protein
MCVDVDTPSLTLTLCVRVGGVLTPVQAMTCVSVHGLLSKLGDTLRACSTAVVCLLLDCCRVVASDGGLPEGVVPEPPQGCVQSCGVTGYVGVG